MGELPTENCGCVRCLTDHKQCDIPGIPVTATRMVVCAECGNKRCPHATDHRFECTKSNEVGQLGSRYSDSVEQ